MTEQIQYRNDIVLASASPRRREMFESLGIPVRICPADVDETLPIEMSPEVSVMYLAFKKAAGVMEDLRLRQGKATGNTVSTGHDTGLIIAADTIVVFGGEIIGKPKDEDEAYRILSAMRGNRHMVVTGVCLIDGQGGSVKHGRGIDAPIRCLYETTCVYFKNYSDEELRAYVSTDEPYDKAGGYAIQETFGKYIERIEGDRDNVIGFPMYRVEGFLQKNEDRT